MTKTVYGKSYFQRYLDTGRFLKNARGDNRALYGYWLRYLKQNYPRGSDILEVGCGLGFFGRRIQEYYEYVGLDISVEALTYASEVHHIKKIVLGGAEKLPFEKDMFDVVFAFDVAEHLEVPLSFFLEAHRVLKPSGILIVSTPNIYSFGVRKKSHSKLLIASMYRDASHVSLFAPEVWMHMVQKAGFSIIRSGTDTLWDIPYFEWIPSIIQKLILIPLNMATLALFGCLKWNQGENLIIVARK